MEKKILGMVLIATIFLFGVGFVMSEEFTCPQDMKTCPNGLSVSRSGPDCEFICPNSELIPGEDYTEGELLVGFNEKMSEEEAKELIVGLNLTLKETHDLWNTNILVINVPMGEEQAWIETLEKENDIDYAELNFIVRTQGEDLEGWDPIKNVKQDVSNNTIYYIIIGAIIVLIITFLIFKKKK